MTGWWKRPSRAFAATSRRALSASPILAPSEDDAMAGSGRLEAVILEVADLEKSELLYREGFGVPLQPGDNAVEDRWIGGRHAEISWRDGHRSTGPPPRCPRAEEAPRIPPGREAPTSPGRPPPR